MSTNYPPPRWRVFLVDDEPGNMELYQHGLRVFCQHAGQLDIEVIESVDDAFSMAKRLDDTHEPILWIVDSMMPYFENEDDGDESFSGLELVRRLMELPNHGHHRYLMMTHLRSTDVERAANGLAVAVFEKAKCSPKSLAAKVDKIVA